MRCNPTIILLSSKISNAWSGSACECVVELLEGHNSVTIVVESSHEGVLFMVCQEDVKPTYAYIIKLTVDCLRFIISIDVHRVWILLLISSTYDLRPSANSLKSRTPLPFLSNLESIAMAYSYKFLYAAAPRLILETTELTEAWGKRSGLSAMYFSVYSSAFNNWNLKPPRKIVYPKRKSLSE